MGVQDLFDATRQRPVQPRPVRTESVRKAAVTWLFGVLLVTWAVGPGAGSCRAQALDAPLYDLKFEVVNATTGEPGRVDRLEIAYFGAVLDRVLDVQPDGARFELPRVPIRESRPYLVTAWYRDVPYFWKLRGSKLIEGVTTLHVFDTSADLSAATIDGLTLMIKRGESLVDLEYLLNVDNSARPQVTLKDDPGTIELELPAGATQISAEYHRGPEPTPVKVEALGGRYVLDAPLTSGSNRIRLRATVPWSEGMILPVVFNLPVAAWSLLATPENLDIQAFELEADLDNDIAGHIRLKGPALDAGRRFEIRLAGGAAAGPGEDLFTTEAPADQEAAATDAAQTTADKGSSFPLVPVLVMLAIVVGLVLVRRRRSS